VEAEEHGRAVGWEEIGEEVGERVVVVGCQRVRRPQGVVPGSVVFGDLVVWRVEDEAVEVVG
jgi:hypothetical protein